MAYKALEKVRLLNRENYGIDGPLVPRPFDKIRIHEKAENGTIVTKFNDITDMEKQALLFIREDCEGLRLSPEHEDCKDSLGKSIKPGQIPYNMEKDLDRLCFENAIHRFMESGRSKDAFDIYFCFLEMFLGEYGRTKKIIEMLSEFETNASSLLMKHRDHYSHSAYVFIMGLAFYHTSRTFRKAYHDSYGKFTGDTGEKLSNEEHAQEACHFLKYWGVTSLFHDIGYPFELTFEQVKSYFGNTIDYVPFVSFNMNRFENSKTADILKKIDKLITEISNDYTGSVLEKNDRLITEDECKKFEKKINRLADDLYGADNAKKPEKFCASGEYREVCLSAIEYLSKLKKLTLERREEDLHKIRKMLPDYGTSDVENLNEFLSAALAKVFGSDYEEFVGYRKFREDASNKNTVDYQNYLFDVLSKKKSPEHFGGFIDHAYFSAIILIECLFSVVETKELNEMYTNALTAIIMHNSLYKFSITNYNDNGENGFNNGRRFRMERHPLAFLLMLCDEIQCWDRTSYGQISRGELHPFDCDLKFNGDTITAKYIFDKNQVSMVGEPNGTYKKLQPKNGKTSFLSDIEHIVSINNDSSFDDTIPRIGTITLKVESDLREDRRYRGSFLSSSNYIHFYKFAVLLHQMNHLDTISEDQIEEKFNELSLEYKINHISRAKKYARYLNEVGCFYSDKPVDMECLYELSEDFQDRMGPLEHERWCWEHYIMGWQFGEAYLNLPKNEQAIVRELTKTHKDMPEEVTDDNGQYNSAYSIDHFQTLDSSDKEKDIRSLNNLLKVLLKVDGIKVYKFK